MPKAMRNKFDELRLLARCALSDDRDAFGQIVEAYQSDMRRFFLNLTGGDIVLSDDLAQETFLKAYLNIRSFRGLSKFRTWLYRIAYNEFYSWARERKEELAESLPERIGSEPATASNIRIDVAEALKLLTVAERTAVTLFFIEDRPVKEIAAIMGMPEGTVKSHIARAKPKLARFLEDKY